MVVRGAASVSQDGRFATKKKKELAKLKPPPEYALKVDFSKIVWTPIQAWVMKRVTELLKGVEDEVLVGTIHESLKQGISAKDLHYDLVPFLCNNTTLFVKELWKHLHSASNNPSGIPEEFEAAEVARMERVRRQNAEIQAKVEHARQRQQVEEQRGRRHGDEQYGLRLTQPAASNRGDGRQAQHDRRAPERDTDHGQHGHEHPGRDAHRERARDRSGRPRSGQDEQRSGQGTAVRQGDGGGVRERDGGGDDGKVPRREKAREREAGYDMHGGPSGFNGREGDRGGGRGREERERERERQHGPGDRHRSRRDGGEDRGRGGERLREPPAQQVAEEARAGESRSHHGRERHTGRGDGREAHAPGRQEAAETGEHGREGERLRSRHGGGRDARGQERGIRREPSVDHKEMDGHGRASGKGQGGSRRAGERAADAAAPHGRTRDGMAVDEDGRAEHRRQDAHADRERGGEGAPGDRGGGKDYVGAGDSDDHDWDAARGPGAGGHSGGERAHPRQDRREAGGEAAAVERSRKEGGHDRSRGTHGRSHRDRHVKRERQHNAEAEDMHAAGHGRVEAGAYGRKEARGERDGREDVERWREDVDAGRRSDKHRRREHLASGSGGGHRAADDEVPEDGMQVDQSPVRWRADIRT